MYYNSADFEFTSALEANWQVIRQEIERINSRDFVEWPERHLYGKGWDVFGLYAFGLKLGKNCELCPESTKLVESIPGLVTAGFSSLKPGTHIAAHTGYPDGVLRCHLGLIGCDGCSLRVGDETRNWQEGKCLVFDDTTEHEAWNRGDNTRIVLLLDFKHPALVSDAEDTSQSTTEKKGLWQQLKQKLFAGS
jgi:ornithine lipid ester-linked acyl 2-hydroxylase